MFAFHVCGASRDAHAACSVVRCVLVTLERQARSGLFGACFETAPAAPAPVYIHYSACFPYKWTLSVLSWRIDCQPAHVLPGVADEALLPSGFMQKPGPYDSVPCQHAWARCTACYRMPQHASPCLTMRLMQAALCSHPCELMLTVAQRYWESEPPSHTPYPPIQVPG